MRWSHARDNGAREVADYPTLVGFGYYAPVFFKPGPPNPPILSMALTPSSCTGRRETLVTPRPGAAVKRAARQDRERHVDTALHDHD